MEKAKPTLKNIIAYIQGNLRYKLYYSIFAFLIPKHIREQITARINSMDRQCYNDGQCKMCGCQTTALQMADKACDKPCYPRMLTRSQWWLMKRTGGLTIEGEYWKYQKNKLVKEAKFIKDE